MSNRRGLTLIEFIVSGSLLVIVIGLMLPAVLMAREASRGAQCKNNLKSIGISFHNYHDAHRVFPQAAMSWGHFPELHAPANPVLPIFIRCGCGVRGYNYEASWKQQPADVVSIGVCLFACPSHHSNKAIEDEFFGSLGETTGNEFGISSYVYCKGVTDAWCRTPDLVPKHERGAFDVDYYLRMDEVTDGASHTIFVGEGATGKPWRVQNVTDRTQSTNPTGWLPHQPWSVPHINTDKDIQQAGPRASLFASTMEPMNKNPVTDTMIDSSALSDCRSSADGGPHRTSNFRSNHADGGFFLFGDGSVRFLNETIDMSLYRGLSTIAGADDADEF